MKKLEASMQSVRGGYRDLLRMVEAPTLDASSKAVHWCFFHLFCLFCRYRTTGQVPPSEIDKALIRPRKPIIKFRIFQGEPLIV